MVLNFSFRTEIFCPLNRGPTVFGFCYELYKAVFPKLFLLADHFCLRKITTDPHILAQVNTVYGYVSKIRYLYLRTYFR
jgi:hypothetical protein